MAKRVSIASVAAALAIALFAVAAPSFGAGSWQATSDTDTQSQLPQETSTTEVSTSESGHVWTDKSVTAVDENGTTFNVTLSALSAALSESSTEALDIVLVLDTSGSMDDLYDDDNVTYTRVSSSNLDTSKVYYQSHYISTSGSYQYIPVRYNSSTGRWYDVHGYGFSSSSIANSPFYEASTGSRMDSLRDSVNTFLTKINSLNTGKSEDQQNHVALVKFAGTEKSVTDIGNDRYYSNNTYMNYSQVVSDFTTDMDSLQTSVNELVPGGMTHSDYGMDLAKQLLDNDTSDRKKIVIFFSDGVPTNQNAYSSTIAGDAVDTAAELKDDDVDIYTIGATNDANPDSTSTNINAFMNALSSNYPDAVGSRYRTFGISLGTRGDGTYYYAARNAQALADAFDSIYSSITESSGYPTNAGSDPAKSGYTTFTDQLGAYMEVKDFTSIELNGVTYTEVSSTTSGDTTTYVFSGTGSTNLTASVNLSDIIVTVTKSSDLSTGDTVTIQVPAAALPAILYSVETDSSGTTMTRTYDDPIQFNYTVGLKDEAVAAASSSDPANYTTSDGTTVFSSDFLAENTDDDGYLNFYSNYWSGGENGNTTASFTPADQNEYYRFAENTPLYTDAEGQTRATSLTSGQTYYYAVTEYTLAAGESSGTPTVSTTYVAITYDELAEMTTSSDDDGVYISAGTYRPDHSTSTTPKAENANKTETASNSNAVSTSADTVTDNLGNNGRTRILMPGKLAITKAIDVPSDADQDDTTFTYSITVDGASGTYDCVVTDADGNTVSGAATSITFTDGEATATLTGGQTITISGLPGNAAYTVTETRVGDTEMSSSGATDGWTIESSSGTSGNIEANGTSSASFTNQYTRAAVTTASLDVTKTLSGRDLTSDDSFTFTVTGTYSGSASLSGSSIPLPANVTRSDSTSSGTITLSQDSGTSVTQSLGDITFSEPGTYTYTITESNGSISGVTYSRAQYTATFVVSDDNAGSLTVSGPTITQVYDDDYTYTNSTASSAAFTNTYNSASINVNLYANKTFTDTTSGTSLTQGEFSFQLTPTGDNAASAPMPTGTEGTGADRVFTATNGSNGSVSLGSLTITQAMVGQTYTYEVAEVIPDGATQNADGTWTLDGYTYDGTTHTVELAVTRDSAGVLHATVTYTDGTTTNSDAAQFTNTYAATSVEQAIEGSKTLTGRDMQDGETYEFTLTADSATQTAIDNGHITAEGMTADELKSMTTTVSGGTDGVAEAFSFDSLTFNHTGTYTFTLSETAGSAGGVTYDTDTCTVTVTVTDVGGQLQATVTYSPTGGNSFTNTYTASYTYPGINVSKTLDGRDLAAGEFSYTITGAAGTGTTEQQANGKLSSADSSFTNPSAASDGEESVWTKLSDITFDQSDAGKTYVYTVRETQGGLGGVTYDTSVYTVSIEVIDDDDGTMHTVTTVKQGDTVLSTADTSADSTAMVEVPFTNTYEATGTLSGATNLQVTKEISGRDWNDSDSYTFTIEASNYDAINGVANGTVVMGDPTSITITSSTTNHTASFGDITFTEPGTYQFDVTETIPDDATATIDGTEVTYANATDEQKADTSISWVKNGITYDSTPKTVEVTVTDNGDGTLTCTKSAYSDPLTFTNTYSPTPATASWNGTKTLTGRDFTTDLNGDGDTSDGDVFYFLIGGTYSGSGNVAVEDIPLPAPLSNVHVDGDMHVGTWTWEATSYDSSDPNYISENQFSLLSGDLTFTVAGTYTYQIREVTGSIPGMTYSNAQYTCTVVVTDDGLGHLTATASLTQQYTDEGTTPSSDQENVQANFVNKAAEDITVTLNGYKDYTDSTGSNPLTNDMFTFELTAETEGAPMPEGTADGVFTSSNQGNGIVLGTIELGQNDVGNTYTYKAKEVIPDNATATIDGATVTYANATEEQKADTSISWELNGMNYAGGVHTITVVVSQDSTTNAISATVTYDGVAGSVYSRFSNSYEPNSATAHITGTKTFTGRDMNSNESVAFTLTGYDTATQQAIASGTVITGGAYSTSVTGLEDGVTTEFAFDGDDGEGFTFTRPGTYTFAMRETAGTAGGVTYDSHTCIVTVTVTDGGTGALEASVSYSTPDGTTLATGQEANDFINAYETTPASVPVSVAKTLTGRTPGLQAGEFSFTMTVTGNPSDGFTLGDGAVNGSLTVTNDADGNVSFGNVTFTKAGTYHVEVVENVPDDQEPFTTYDDNVYSFDVTVTDNGNGALEAVTSNVQGSSQFANTYNPPDNTKSESTVSSDGSIVISDADGNMVSVGDRIRYTINWVNDAVDATTGEAQDATVTVTDTVPAGTTFVENSATNGGNVSFSGPDDDGTLTWTISAAAGETGTVTFDVTVDESALDLAGNTFENTATVTIGDNSSQTNTVGNSVPEKDVLNASGLSIDGQTVQVGDTLTFRVYYANAEEMPVSITITDPLSSGLDFVDAQNGGQYDEDTRTITWTLDNVQPSTDGYVTFRATVNENALELSDKTVTNQATLTVPDGSYTTNTTTNPVKTGDLTLRKTVQLDDPTSTTIDTTKSFTFTVTLKDKNGNELEGAYAYTGNDGTSTISGTITSGGTVSLKTGGYVTIEDLPAGATWSVAETGSSGYTPDSAVKEGTIPSDDVVTSTFTNTYRPKTASVPLSVTKVLTGRDPGLVDGEFSFKAEVEGPDGGSYMTDSDGVVTNSADGTVDFGNVYFTKAGTYTVTVHEIVPGSDEDSDGTADPFITYDEHEYTFTVTVTDDRDGNLVATVGEATGSSTFTNTYNPPDDTKSVTQDIDGVTTDVDGQQVGVGDTLTYTVHWVNDAVDATTGASIAAEITVTDTVPAGTTLDEDSITATVGDTVLTDVASVETVDGETVITWNLGEQAAGAEGDVSFEVTVDESAVDNDNNTIENEAQITVGSNDPKTTNKVTNTVPEKTVGQTPASDTGTTITDADGNLVGVGDVLTYTISWTNDAVDANGNAVSADVVITDTLPAGTTYVTGSGSGDDAHPTTVFTEPDATGKMTWTIPGAAAGDSGTVTYQVTVDESVYDLATPTVENQATVTVGNQPAVSTNTTENPLPEKTVSQTPASDTGTTITDADGNLVGVGDVLTYRIDWQNLNDAQATVVISDATPAGTEFVTGSAKAYDADGQEMAASVANIQTADGVTTWYLYNQEPGTSGYVEFQVTVTDEAMALAGKTVENQATVTIGDDPSVDTNVTENPVPAKTVSDADGNDVDGQTVQVGDTLTYTVSWTNDAVDADGNAAAADVTIIDAVPAGTTYVADSATVNTPTAGSVSSTSAAEADGTVTWTFHATAGASGTVEFQVKVNEDALTQDAITNTASVTVGDGPTVSTNTTTNDTDTGQLSIIKNVDAAEGLTAPTDKEFTFQVTLQDSSRTALTGLYTITGADKIYDTTGADVTDAGVVGNGYQVQISAGGTATITGIPQGAYWGVREMNNPGGFQADRVYQSGQIPADSPVVTTTFTNTYDTENCTVPITVTKIMDGRDLVAGEFEFTMTVDGHEPSDDSLSLYGWQVTPAGDNAAGEAVNDVDSTTATMGSVDFGNVTFTEAGVYTVTIKEVVPDDADKLPFVTYDDHEATFKIEVYDAGDGTLAYYIEDADGNRNFDMGDISFTNTYNPPDNTKTVEDTTLEITDADGRQVQIGDTLHYTIDWVNDAIDETTGSSSAATVTVTDTVPAGTTFVEGSATSGDGVSFSGPDDDGTLTWTIDAEAGETGSVSFDVTVDESVADNAYAVDNTATVTIGDDANTTNTTHNTVPEKDVSDVTNSITDADGQLVGLGDTLQYTIHWRNDAVDADGNATAATVKITDPLPAYTTYVDGSASDGGTYTANEDAAADESKGTAAWEFEAAAGAEGTVTFQVTVDEDAYELYHNDIDNTATVQIGDGPVVSTNTTENLVPEKDVSSTSGTGDDAVTILDADGQQVGVGDVLTYRILYWNREGETVNMLAYDTVPEGTEYVEGSAKIYQYGEDGQGHMTDTPVEVTGDDVSIDDSDGQHISWQFRNIAPGVAGYAEFQVVVTEEATQLATSTIDNQATCQIGHSATVTTNTTTNPVPEKDVSITPASDSDTTITDADGNLVGVGDELTYTVSYTNTATDDDGNPADATVTITDAVPEGTEYVDGSATVDTPTSGSVSETSAAEADGTVTWQFTASAGTSGTVSFKVKVTEEATQLATRQIDNTATVQLNDGPAVSTNTVTNPVPEKTVDVTSGSGDTQTTITDADGRQVGTGDTLTYRVYWTNDEDQAATVTVTDATPAGTSFVSGSAKAYDADGNELSTSEANIQTSNGTTTWTLYNQAAGASGYVEFQVTVTDEAASLPSRQVDNTAYVQIGDNPSVSTNTVTNPVPGKDVSATPASDSDTVISDADGNLVGVGDVLTYTIGWSNDAVDEDGNPAEADVVITDAVPEGTAYVDGSAAMGETSTGSVSDTSVAEADGTVTWSFHATAGASGTVTFQVTVTEDATDLPGHQVENTAYVQIGSNPATATNTTTNPVPYKTVDQTTGTTTIYDADGNLVGVGDTLTYTVHWTNTATDTEGNPAASQITITDAVPEGTTYADGSAAVATPTSGSVSNAVASESDGTVTWTFDATAGAEGTVTFQVTVTEDALSLDPDDNTVENTASVKIGDNPSVSTNTVTNPVPEKSVDVTSADDGSASTIEDADGNLVGVGDVLTYTIAWTNTATDTEGNPADAEITVTDIVPDGTSYVDGSATMGDTDTSVVSDVTAGEADGTVTWTFTAEAGASGVVEFQVQVEESALTNGSVDNTGTVKIGDGPAVKTNTVTNPTPGKDVQNAQGASIDGKYVGVGDTLHYVISFANTEDSPATITVVDTIPTGTEYVSGSAQALDADGNAMADATIDASDGTITWTLSNVAANTSGTAEFDVTVTDAVYDVDGQQISNQASVNGVKTNTVTNSVPEKDVSKSEDGTVTILDANGQMVGVGDELTYTVHWENVESSVANVRIVDTIPAGTEYVSGSAQVLDEDGNVISSSSITVGDAVTATVYNQQPGASGTVTFRVTVTEEAYDLASGFVENTATVQVDGDAAVETNPVDNPVPHKSVDATSGEGSDAVTITDADGRQVQVGDTLTYTVTWQNDTVDEDGNPADADVTITDAVPEGTSYVDGSAEVASVDGVTGAAASEADGTVTWTFHAAAGTSGTVTFQVKVTEDALSLATDDNTVENTATVQIGSDNPAVSTNTVTNSVPEKTVADETLGITDADGSLVQVGDVLTYTIQWTNAEKDSARVFITDEIPAGTELVAGSISDGGINGDGTIGWDLGEQASGATGTVSFQVKVTGEGLTGSTVENTANVQIGDNPAVSTNPVTDFIPSKDVQDPDTGESIDGQLVQVGDTLHYVVSFTNTTSETATVTVKDTVPTGTTFTEGSTGYTVTPTSGVYGGTVTTEGPDDDGTIVWTIGDVPAGASGTVSFDVTVTEDAFDNGHLVENTATVQLGDDPAVSTNTVTNGVPEKEGTDTSGADVDGGEVTIGDVITYTVTYVNPESTASTVTVTDTIPEGTEYVTDSAKGDAATITGPDDSGKITWVIDNVGSGESGTVSFRVRVTADAMTSGQVENTADIQIGSTDPAVSTNTVTTDVKAGGLTISKAVEADEGMSPNATDQFTFTVTLTDASGTPLTGTYNFSGTVDGTTSYNGTITSGGTVSLAAGGSVTIADLPDGTEWTVEETEVPTHDVDGVSVPNYTTGQSSYSGTIDAFATDEAAVSTAAFTNTYQPTGTASIELEKVLEGRNWLSSDSFTFTIAGSEGAPMPTNTSVTVTSDMANADGSAPIDFGDITFDSVGTYTYTVTETNGGQTIDGVTYDSHSATVTVTVTDDGNGTLTTATTVSNGTFTNSYEPGSVNFDAVAGLQIVKTMTGKDIAAGDFTFQLKGVDAASTAKLTGGADKTYQTTAQSQEDGVATEAIPAETGLVFTAADAGKTYTYTVTEDNGGQTIDGVTYDGTTHTVSFAVTEDQQRGTLTVDVTVDGTATLHLTNSDAAGSHDAVSVGFDNSYAVTPTSLTLNATKTLTGQNLVANEFAFRVTDAVHTDYIVSSGTNDASGNVNLSAIDYTIDSLEAEYAAGYSTRTENADGTTTYTYHYTVSEDGLDATYGITQDARSFNVTVTVTHDGKGNLTAEATYPDGSTDGSLAFANEYKTDSVDVQMKGSKQLNAVSDIEPPDITGEYTFTLTGSDGAPMPSKTTAANDANGTVDFGTITYTMDNVFGSEEGEQGQERSKTFTYTITESGTVAQVTNDPQATKTVTVTVTDDGYGNLTASTSVATGELFTFVNTYTHKYQSVTGGFSLTKHLDGRDLVAGEFQFQLTDASGEVVSTGYNDADGNVDMAPITFEREGDYTYTLSEVAGSASGVTYDTTQYTAVAHVTDPGDGTLELSWTFTQDGTEVATPEFSNGYEKVIYPTSVTLGASKVLQNGTLSEGEFDFGLYDEDGSLLQTKSNDANGSVQFDSITYDAAGTYTYTIAEILPTDDDSTTAGVQKDGITYDETQHTVVVEVVENDDGYLTATVTYDGTAASSVFSNVVPVEPPTPTEPPETPTPQATPPETTTSTPTASVASTSTTKFPKTGDDPYTALVLLSVVGVAACTMAAALHRRRRDGSESFGETR